MTFKSSLRQFATPSLLRLYHKGQAILAATYYGFPGRRLHVIGVTGTNGKTTTVHLIGAILRAAGQEVALASTVAFQINEEVEPNALNMTTPSPWVLQRFLARAVAKGVHIAIVETTSHAIDQERIWGISYAAVVFTNLTHDHLDYHKTFEDYRQTKLRLFTHNPRVAVVNADDASAKFFLEQPAYQQYTFGLEARADVSARKILLEPTGTLFTAITPVGQVAVNLALPGKFNVANALAAIAIGVSQGISLEVMKHGLESVVAVPGRMERIDAGQSFTVLVDYAHTPDAFEQIYSNLRPVTRGRIIHVFGATGDRDRTKRPIMGALAARNADIVVLTNDEPYTEDPEKIIDEIVAGLKRGRMPKSPNDKTQISNKDQNLKTKSDKKPTTSSGEEDWWWRITDRRAAIAQALELARKDDVVLISGMGDERFMTIADEHGALKKIPWEERRIVKQLLLQKLHNVTNSE